MQASTLSDVLIFGGMAGGLAGGAYCTWRLVRRGRGRGDPAGHPQLRVIAIASAAAFAVAVGASIAIPLNHSSSPPASHSEHPLSRPHGPTQEALQEIDSILAGLPLATVAFNVPTDVALGESVVIQLLLSTKAPIADLQRKVTEAGERVGARIKVSDRMEARLTGPRFKIEAITPEAQAISSSELTTWRWEVEPTATGRQRLHLTLSAILDVRGSPSTRMIRTFDRTLAVDVSLSKRVANFLGNNWQWLWTAILVPAVAWYAARRKRRAPGDPHGGPAAGGT